MNEDSARAVTLLQAFETAQPPSPHWLDEDRAWATRLALDEGRDLPPAEFIARRGRHALARLGPREPAAAAWLARRLWDPQWLAWSVLAGGLLGLAADSIGGSRHINLLAPPLWAVLAWNGIVYLLLIGHGLARLMRRPTRPGLLLRLTEALMRRGRRLPGAGSAPAAALDGAPPLALFAGLWLRRSGRLAASRAACLLHGAAAALGAGLVGGLYLRGLVLDYRAGWESTFLSASAAHAALAAVLAPASLLSGIGLPDAAAFEALRSVPAVAGSVGASAAPWIHLLALTLVLFVVLPRGLLAAAAALRARWLARRFPMPLDDPYFQRLARQQRGDVARVAVQPYAATIDADMAGLLQRMLAPVLGDGLQVEVLPGVDFGAEDMTAPPLPEGATLVLALFDLSATPEDEHHGRFVQALAASAPVGAATLVLVDETGFRRRFGAGSARLGQRRDAWRRFGESLGSVPVYLDLELPDLPGGGRAVQLALRNPVARVGA